MAPGQKLIAKDPYIIREDGKPSFTVGKEYIAEPLEGFRLFKVVTNLGETYHFGYHELETYFKDASQPEPMPAPAFGTWHPIETAPKDGTEILLFCEDGSTSLGAFRKYWVARASGVDIETEYGTWEVANPTHYTPLPKQMKL